MAMMMNLSGSHSVQNVGGRVSIMETVPTSSFNGERYTECLSEACACLTTNPNLNKKNIRAAFEQENGPALIAVNSKAIGAPIGPNGRSIGGGRDVLV